MTVYRTRDGDMVDALAKAHYGREDMTAAVYRANPGLAAKGAVLPAGILIRLPDPGPEPVRRPVRLWGAPPQREP
ncbi:MAG: tail protein X [Rhodospirillales bacterium]|nr:tail protein X [Rhodospirillales bacterium]